MAYDTVSTLKAEILAKCQDAAFGPKVVEYLNDCMREVSGRVQLPSLLSSSHVHTSTTLAYVSMPTDFQRNLYKCFSNTNSRWIKVYDSLADLHSRFSTLDQGGAVSGVVEQGGTLYYQRLPGTAEQLDLYYLKIPTVITASSTPGEIPEEFSKPLFVSYALKEIFLVKAIREQGMADAATLYQQRFEQELGKLISRLGPERRPAVGVNDEMNLDILF